MLLTEEEAKEMGCCGPAGIVTMLGVIILEQGGNVKFEDGAGKCMASKCQAWRWQPLMADQPFMDAVKKRMDDSKDKHPAAVKYVRANLSEYGLPDKPFRGYCGLAGKP